MAENAATRPARTRAAKATTAKAAPAKSAPAAAKAAEAEKPEVVTFVHAGDTKNYAKFVPEDETTLKGSLYAPLGTTAVRVAVYGATE